MKRSVGCVMAMTLLVCPASALGAAPTTEQFRVNPFNGLENRNYPDVALDDDGEMTVVYQGPVHEDDPTATDEDPNIVIRRFDAGTNLLRYGFASLNPNHDIIPSMAALPDGRFVAAWGSGEEGLSSEDFQVRARVVDPNHADPATWHLTDRLDTDTLAAAAPAVALDADGTAFTLVWSVFGCSGMPPVCFSEIKARRYLMDGTPLGTPVDIEPGGLASDVATTPDGIVVVSAGGGLAPGSEADVLFRRYSVDGADIEPIGPPAGATADPAGREVSPTVSTDSDGDFAISWQTSGGNPEIEARRFSAAGVPLTGDLSVNENPGNVQGHPHVASAADGDFVVTWTDFGPPNPSPPPGALPSDVKIREFSATGVARGSEVLVSQTSDRPNTVARAVWGAGDRIAVVWVRGSLLEATGEWKQSGQVFARRFVSSDTTLNPPGGPGPPNPSPLPPEAAAKLDLASRLTVSNKGVVKLKIECPAQLDPACDVLVSASSVKKVAVGAAARPKRKRLSLGRKRYTIPQGTTRTVNFKVSKAGRRYLRRKGPLRVRFVVTTGRERDTAVATLRVAKRKKRG